MKKQVLTNGGREGYSLSKMVFGETQSAYTSQEDNKKRQMRNQIEEDLENKVRKLES